jgi:signal transduction histidine kinase
LSHSFCQHVVADDTSLVVADARRDPRLRDNQAIDDLDVVAYLGVPLRSRDGHVLGSFCVIDAIPREWTPEEVALVEDLAALAQTELNRHGAGDGRALAHDVRSTLHGVVGGARTLAGRRDLDEQVRGQLMEVVERQARHLEALLTRMLGDADVSGDGLAVVDVRQLVDDVVEDYEVTGVASVHHRRDGPALALGDPTALRRCLTNLVDNALKHGGNAVEVATGSDGEVTRITVSDDGPGIALDQQDLIFDWGHRGSTAAPGNGFGLATVRELTRAMGGDVTVTSEPGGGTTFVLRLRPA